MEYGHRMWGRAIGTVFYIPAAIFWARGWYKSGMKKRIVGFGTLIALQVRYIEILLHCSHSLILNQFYLKFDTSALRM